MDQVSLARPEETDNPSDADPVICSCFEVSASTIKMAMNVADAKTSADIRETTMAGSGCGACACRVERILAGFPAQCGPCALCSACGHISKLCRCA